LRIIEATFNIVYFLFCYISLPFGFKSQIITSNSICNVFVLITIPCICVYFYISIYPSFHLFIYISIHTYFHQPFFHAFIHLFISTYSRIYYFARSSIHLFLHPSKLSIHTYIYFDFVFISKLPILISQFIHPFHISLIHFLITIYIH